MGKQKKEELKISLNKMIIILLIIVIFAISYLGVLYFINNNNKIENVSQEIDYKEKYGLKYTYTKEISDNIILSMPYSDDLKVGEGETFSLYYNNSESYYDMVISLCEAKYNFENYSVDKYVEEYEGITNKKTIKNDKIELCYFEQNEEEYGTIYSYYIIKYDNKIVTFDAYYARQDIYEKYNEIVTYMISNIDITDNNEKMSKYIDIAFQDSSYKRAYESLTNSQKEKYDILYKKLLINKEKHYADVVYDSENNPDDEYDIAIEALNRDMLYLGFEHYNINNDYIWDEETETEDYVFYAEYSKNIYIPTTDLKYGMLYTEVVELTDKELEIFNKNVDDIINNIPDNLSTYGKYKYIAKAICEICEYDYEELEKKEPSDRIHSMIGVFVDGKAVCDGYAWAYYYICNKIGLFCNYIDGNAANDSDPGHAFNYIKLGGKYYFVDVTWFDEGEESFAFTYNSATENDHNEYIEDWFDVKFPEYSPFKELMKKLGTIDWYNIQNIYNQQNVCE